MHNMPIWQKIALGFSVLLLLVLLLGGIAVKTLYTLEAGNTRLRAQLLPFSDVVFDLRRNILRVVGNLGDYLLTDDVRYWNDAQRELLFVRDLMRQLTCMVRATPEFRHLAPQVRELQRKADAYASVVHRSRDNYRRLWDVGKRLYETGDHSRQRGKAYINAHTSLLQQTSAPPEEVNTALQRVLRVNSILCGINSLRGNLFAGMALQRIELPVERNPPLLQTLLQSIDARLQTEPTSEFQVVLEDIKTDLSTMAGVQTRYLELWNRQELLEKQRTVLSAAMVSQIQLLAEFSRININREFQLHAADTDSALRMLLGASGAIFLLGLAFAVALTRYLTTPLLKSRDFALAVSKGDLTRRLELEQTDEIGQMVKGMNAMVEALNAKISEAHRNEQGAVEARNQALRAQSAAEDANRVKDDFLDRMSHELRTPMNAVIGLSHLCLQTCLDNRQRGYVSNILHSAHNLLGVLTEILDFSKGESGELVIERLPFHLEDVMDNLRAVLTPRLHDKPLRISYHVAEDIPHTLHGDPLRLTQVLLHIAGNAIKFTEAGEVSVTAALAQRTADDVVLRFTVRDTGIGIEPRQAETLFQPFVQADGSITRRFGGTGLGLAFSRHLAKLMGGDIRMESVPDRGSAFTIDVRLGLKAADQRHPRPGARVLLVEDNDINQEIALELLTGMHMHVDVASDGQEAVDAVESASYDLIFMDVQMPVMDGLEATRRIRAAGHAMPIIAMTAHALRGDRETSLASGMNAHLTKPLSPERLYQMLADWLPQAEAPASPSDIPATSPSGDREAAAAPEAQKNTLAGPPVSPTLPAGLPGINIEAGLAAVGGNGRLYAHLLNKFATRYAAAQEDIAALLQKNDAAAAVQLAHTIKGVAANLGAASLAEAAGMLEKNLLRAPDDAAQYMTTLNTCMDEAVAAAHLLIEAFPPGHDGMPPSPASPNVGPENGHPPTDDGTLARQVQDILDCMETDWNRASEQARQICATLRGTPLEAHGRAFAQAVDDFDMESVAAEGDALLRNMAPAADR